MELENESILFTHPHTLPPSPTNSIMSVTSNAELFSDTLWEEVFAEAGVAHRDPRNLLGNVHVFMQTTESGQNWLLSGAGYDESSTQKIVDVLANWLREAPAVKRRKVESACLAPSSVGDPMVWFPSSKIRMVVDSIANHRHSSTRTPLQPIHGVPITLLVEEFGQFQDELNSTDSHSFLLLALKLMLEMSKIYADEGKRTQALYVCLKDTFSLSSINDKEYKTDLSPNN